MDGLNPTTQPAAENTDGPARVRLFGVGDAGLAVLELLTGAGFPVQDAVAVNTDPASLRTPPAATKLQLEPKPLRALSSGADPDRAAALAEERAPLLQELCQGVDLVFIVVGLGGGCGTGAAPVLAQIAREKGALVLAFATTPFECEGSRRRQLAQKGLERLNEAADGVICLPNQKVFKLLDESTSVVDAFKRTNGLLADAVRSLWLLAMHKGLIELHFNHLCELLRDRHTQSAFAVAEASGPARTREVVDKILNHPLLDGGAILSEADTVLVNVMGGPDLTLAEVNRVMQELNSRCEGAQLALGATIHKDFQERLAVAIVATHGAAVPLTPSPRTRADDLPDQLLSRSSQRTESRFVPPAPDLGAEQVQQLMARQGTGNRGRKARPKMRQTQLPLEIVSKGRFDKSEPTIHKGEDLDVPTYIRRGVALN